MISEIDKLINGNSQILMGNSLKAIGVSTDNVGSLAKQGCFINEENINEDNTLQTLASVLGNETTKSIVENLGLPILNDVSSDNNQIEIKDINLSADQTQGQPASLLFTGELQKQNVESPNSDGIVPHNPVVTSNNDIIEETPISVENPDSLMELSNSTQKDVQPVQGNEQNDKNIVVIPDLEIPTFPDEKTAQEPTQIDNNLFETTTAGAPSSKNLENKENPETLVNNTATKIDIESIINNERTMLIEKMKDVINQRIDKLLEQLNNNSRTVEKNTVEVINNEDKNSVSELPPLPSSNGTEDNTYSDALAQIGRMVIPSTTTSSTAASNSDIANSLNL